VRYATFLTVVLKKLLNQANKEAKIMMVVFIQFP